MIELPLAELTATGTWKSRFLRQSLDELKALGCLYWAKTPSGNYAGVRGGNGD